MQDIEPYYNWRHWYTSEEDENSPFYKREYSEFEYTNTIYNYFIHPQWDDFGSSTLYLKVLFADYTKQFVIIEFIGEWNDCITNDIMFLKRDVIDRFIENGINKFILIGENVLNFHNSDSEYYEEWWDDIKDTNGWIALLNLREHVVEEMKAIHLDNYMNFGDNFTDINWRIVKPQHLPKLAEGLMMKALK